MSRVGRCLAWCGGAVRRQPIRASLGLVVALASVALAGVYGWAAFSWRRAQADFAAKRYDEAGRRLEFCRRVWPRDASLLLLSAKASRRAGDLESAETYLDRYYATHPESRDEAQLETLLLRAQAGDDSAITPLFALVEEGHPQSAAILELVSLNYILRLRYQLANDSLTKWVEVFPDQALPYDWRGWVYERTASPALALRDYQKALELDPKQSLVRLRLVELLLDQKKVTEVAPHLEVLSRLEPDRVEVTARLGILRFLEGRSQEARHLLEAAEAKLDPTDVTPSVYLARLDVQEGKGADAERRLRRVAAVDPSDSDARFVLIAALRLQGKEAEAAAAAVEQDGIRARNERVNELLRDRADRPDATPDEWSEVGRLFLEMAMEPRALYWFDKALARDPNHQATHRVLAEYYDRTGKPGEAASHRRRLR